MQYQSQEPDSAQAGTNVSPPAVEAAVTEEETVYAQQHAERFTAGVDSITRQLELSTAGPRQLGALAAQLVDTEKRPKDLAHHVACILQAPGTGNTAARVCLELVLVLAKLQRTVRTGLENPSGPWHSPFGLRKRSLLSAPAQLQEAGLLAALQETFAAARRQRQQQQKQGSEQQAGRASASSCGLGHGSGCPALPRLQQAASGDTAAAGKGSTAPSAPAGAGPPCGSCMIVHAGLLTSCRQLLEYYPEWLLSSETAGWAFAAAECALDMLQDVSTIIQQHHEQHMQQQHLQQQHQVLAGTGQQGEGSQASPEPPQEARVAGLAALHFLAALCGAVVAPGFKHAKVYQQIQQKQQQQQQQQQGDMLQVLEHPCIVSGMLAAAAAAVLGQEMQQRLLHRGLLGEAGGGSSSSSIQRDGVSSTSAGATAAACAAAAADSTQPGDATASCSSSSSSTDMHGTAQAADADSASEAAWRLVCEAEQWAGGRVLPQPLTVLVETLGCSPPAFLYLACLWCQQRLQHHQQQPLLPLRQQADSVPESAEQQQQQQISSLQQVVAGVLREASKAHCDVWELDGSTSPAPLLGPLRQQDPHLQQLADRGCLTPRTTLQHLLLGVLCMRWAVRVVCQGTLQQPEAATAAAAAPAVAGAAAASSAGAAAAASSAGAAAAAAAPAAAAVQQHMTQQPASLQAAGVSDAAALASQCLSVWHTWAGYEQQQPPPPQQQQQQKDQAYVQEQLEQQVDPSWALGGGCSSAALLELLQGQCRLLQTATRQLQTALDEDPLLQAELAASDSSDSSSSSSSAVQEPPRLFELGEAADRADMHAAQALGGVRNVLQGVLAAAAAGDAGLLQQCAPLLFWLAGTLEALLRARDRCHVEGLVMRIDGPLLDLLIFLCAPQNPMTADAYLQQLQQQGPRSSRDRCGIVAVAASAADAGVPPLQACGLLITLAILPAASGSQQQTHEQQQRQREWQRQLLGLLLTALKLFMGYPRALYAFSFSQIHQDTWLEAVGATIMAACLAGRAMLVLSGPWTEQDNAAAAAPCGGSSSGSGQPQQQQHQQQGEGEGSGAAGGSCGARHSCGLAADGVAALLPWLVLLGRAQDLWVQLFDSHVQLPSPSAAAAASSQSGGRDKQQKPKHKQKQGAAAAGASTGKAKQGQGTGTDDITYVGADLEPYSLVGSAKALAMLSLVLNEAVIPTVNVLATALARGTHEWDLSVNPDRSSSDLGSGSDSDSSSTESESSSESSSEWAGDEGGERAAKRAAIAIRAERQLFSIPGCLWPASPQPRWADNRLVALGQQLAAHCSSVHGLEWGADLHRRDFFFATELGIMAYHVMQSTVETLAAAGDGAKERHRMRQSDIRRYLRSWEISDPRALKEVTGKLSGGEQSVLDVAVACWLCCPAVVKLLECVHVASVSLSLLPIHEACNDTQCPNFEGRSEQGLVSGKACVCGGCRRAHYCSRDCQRQHWVVHKEVCARMGQCKQ